MCAMSVNEITIIDSFSIGISIDISFLYTGVMNFFVLRDVA